MATTLTWHYGPTEADPDPGKRWHVDCGGEVWYIDGGDICRKCGAQADEPPAGSTDGPSTSHIGDPAGTAEATD